VGCEACRRSKGLRRWLDGAGAVHGEGLLLGLLPLATLIRDKIEAMRRGK
jgi:hypothetical protein